MSKVCMILYVKIVDIVKPLYLELVLFLFRCSLQDNLLNQTLR